MKELFIRAKAVQFVTFVVRCFPGCATVSKHGNSIDFRDENLVTIWLDILGKFL